MSDIMCYASDCQNAADVAAPGGIAPLCMQHYWQLPDVDRDGFTGLTPAGIAALGQRPAPPVSAPSAVDDTALASLLALWDNIDWPAEHLDYEIDLEVNLPDRSFSPCSANDKIEPYIAAAANIAPDLARRVIALQWRIAELEDEVSNLNAIIAAPDTSEERAP